MLDLNSLRYFLCTVEQGSLSQAAKYLNIPKSKLSRHIRSLEIKLGYRLFSRHHNRLQLTSEGSRLVKEYQPLYVQLQQKEDWLQDLQKEPAGLLKMSAPSDLMNTQFSYSLADFCKLYPNVDIDCRVSSQFDQFACDDFDIALLINSFQLPDGDYIAKPLFLVQAGIYLAPELANRAENLEEDWMKLPVISHSFESNWVFGEGNQLFSVPIEPRYRVDSIIAQKMLATKALGVVRLPAFLAEQELNAGMLMCVSGRRQPEPFQVCVAYRERNFIPKKVQAFIDYYRQNAHEMFV
jgi:DNA-binding transcriptional LysR family regulator